MAQPVQNFNPSNIVALSSLDQLKEQLSSHLITGFPSISELDRASEISSLAYEKSLSYTQASHPYTQFSFDFLQISSSLALQKGDTSKAANLLKRAQEVAQALRSSPSTTDSSSLDVVLSSAPSARASSSSLVQPANTRTHASSHKRASARRNVSEAVVAEAESSIALPLELNSLFKRAIGYKEIRNYDLAIDSFKILLAKLKSTEILNSDINLYASYELDILKEISDLYFKTGQFSQAIIYAQKGLKLAETINHTNKKIDFLLISAKGHLKLERPLTALQLLEKIMELDPAHQRALTLYKHIQTQLEARPNFPLPPLSSSLLPILDVDRAMRSLQKVPVNPSQVTSLLSTLKKHLRSRQPFSAIEILKKIYAIDPGNIEAARIHKDIDQLFDNN